MTTQTTKSYWTCTNCSSRQIILNNTKIDQIVIIWLFIIAHPLTKTYKFLKKCVFCIKFARFFCSSKLFNTVTNNFFMRVWQESMTFWNILPVWIFTFWHTQIDLCMMTRTINLANQVLPTWRLVIKKTHASKFHMNVISIFVVHHTENSNFSG